MIGSIVRLNAFTQSLGYNEPYFTVENEFLGGMGSCLKLRHIETKTVYALKTVKTELIGESDIWGRFIEELKIWFVVSSCDGIAEGLFIERWNELPCMCATWMDGGNLRPVLKGLSDNKCYRILLRVIGALEWAHTNHGVIHRDLKPENILLDRSGNAYVSDWGLARPVTRYFQELSEKSSEKLYQRPDLTQADQFLGTARYASPEQIIGKDDINHRADIYSLGCMMYEMEQGCVPFDGPTLHSILQQHINTAPEKIGSFFKSSRYGLDKVIYKCLEKDPDKRYQSYIELKNDILEIVRRRGIPHPDTCIKERYSRSIPGEGNIQDRIQYWTDNNKAIVAIEQGEAILQEASSLMGLGRYNEAAEILMKMYLVSEKQIASVDCWSVFHSVAVNYAFCLTKTHASYEDISSVFKRLEHVKNKSAEYYINYSLAAIGAGDFDKSEKISSEGLTLYPEDPDVIGNLLISKRFLRKYEEALVLANKRLSQERTVHSLEDVAGLLFTIGESIHWADWPKATKHYKAALSLINEAVNLNPHYWGIRYTKAQILKTLYKFGQASEEVQEICKRSGNSNIHSASVALFVDILFQMKEYQSCISVSDEWVDQVNNSDIKEIITKTRMKALADGFMIGFERDGQRVLIPDVVNYFERINGHKCVEPDDAIYLAKIYDWIGRLMDAWNVLNSKILDFRYWKTDNLKAWILAEQGLYQQAIDSAKQAIMLAPHKPDPLDMLSAIYTMAGFQELAADAKRQADDIYNKELELASLHE